MSLIDSFFTGTLTITRQYRATYVDGLYVPGAMETFTISGSLQPLSPRELKMVEEGNRIRQYYKLYSDKPILLDNPSTLSGADRITIDGESYKVVSVNKWYTMGVSLPHFKSILYREPETGAKFKQ